jgi:hypothetical protein
MATLTPYSKLTLIEQARRKDPSGNLSVIAEVLNEDNPIIQDAPWVEANDTWAHKTTRRSYVPSASWRKLNGGVGTASTRTIEVIDGIGMLEIYAENDKDLIDSFPNPMQARMDEARGFIEGISQQLAYSMFYQSTVTTPERFNGFAARMASLATTTNVRNAGGSGSDLTSIFIVQWGLDKVHMVYPKGHPFMGIKHTDMGEVTVSTATTTANSTAQYQAYRDHFQVKCGLVVRDERCIARLANIESTGSSNIFDEDDLITILNRMPMAGRGATLYVNDTVLTQMEIALKDKNNVNYTPANGEGLAGEPVLYFRKNPVKKCDQIVITESALT